MSYTKDLEEVKLQQEQAKSLWTKLQGIIEYLEAKVDTEDNKNVAIDDKKVVKKK